MISQRVIKAICLLIVSAVLFAQFTAVSHAHDVLDHSPEPAVCMACIAASQNDGDLDIPPPESTEPSITILISYTPLTLTEPCPLFGYVHETARASPHTRSSAPRAPPH